MASTKTSVITARIPNESKDIIDTAIKTSNSTIREVMIDLANKLNIGELEFHNGKINITVQMDESSNLDLSDFLDACDSKGIEPQDAINKAAQMVWRG